MGKTTSKTGLKLLLFFLGLDILVVCAIFFSGLLSLDGDAGIYAGQVKSFTEGYYDLSSQLGQFFYKPFYGIAGSWLAFIFDPYQAILFINILFLVGLTAVSYYFYKELGFDQSLAKVGVIWTIFSYAMLKSGVAILTDIGGWFFCVLVILVSLRAVKQNKLELIVLASLLGFIGSLCKETGALGLIFSGLYIIFQWRSWGIKKVFTWLAALVIPFLFLETLFFIIIKLAGATFLFSRYGENLGYARNYYKLSYFIGVQGSTFNIISLFSLFGLWQAIKYKDILKRDWLKYYPLLFITATPVFLWPAFDSRVLFMQFIYLIPLALYGISRVDMKFIKSRYAGIIYLFLVFLPPLASLTLYLLSKGGSLFKVFKIL